MVWLLPQVHLRYCQKVYCWQIYDHAECCQWHFASY